MKKADGWSMGQEEQKKKALEEKLRKRAYTAAFEAAQQRKEKPWQSWDEAFSERLAKQPFITEEERKPFAPSGAGAQNAFYTGEKQPWPGLGEAWPGQARRAERTPWAALPENLPDGAGAQNAFYTGEKQPWPGLGEAWPGQARRAERTPWAALSENPPSGAGTMLLAGQRRSMAQATPGGEPPAGPEQGAPGFALEGVDPAYRDAVYAGQALAELLRPKRRKAGTETGKALQPGGGYGTLRAEENGEGLAAIGQNGVSDLTQAVDGGEKQQSGGTEKNGTPPPEAWIDKPPQPDGWIEDTQHTDGQRGKIQYYGQEYQGTWKNGELYLDETSQYLFLVQTGVVGSIPSYLLYDKYKGLSVSQIVNEARLPLDPSKPLPKASSDVQEAIDCVELPPEVTEHAKYLYQTLPGGTQENTTHRFVDKANTAGPVTVTDVTVVEAPPEKITNSTRSLADYIAQATQQVSLFGPGDSVGVGSVNGKPIDGDLVMGILGLLNTAASLVPNRTYEHAQQVKEAAPRVILEEKDDENAEERIRVAYEVVVRTGYYDAAGRLVLDGSVLGERYIMGVKQ